jgi:hypothetical protein
MALALLAGCAPALRGPRPAGGAGEADPAALLAEVQATIRRAEGEPDARARQALAARAVESGETCSARAPGDPRCDYALALALGVQARERPATAIPSLKLMLERLRRADAADPALDLAGPERVMALVLLRAPGWPLGPGDPESGLAQARKAAARFPDHPPNQLALAEALLATGAVEEGRAAARRAVELGQAGASRGDPDAARWAADAERLLRSSSP